MITKQNTIKWILILGILCTAVPLLAETEKVPHEIAGIALGANVNDFPDIIQNDALREVVVTNWHGFRKGFISYGTCKNINQILKMDMKYADKSEEFYQQLLRKFREDFGEPDSWSGDSFGVMKVWKWQFIDKEKNSVSLALQYNGKNSNETLGNVVRLAYPDKIEEERLCFLKVCEQNSNNTDEKRKAELQKSGWSYLVPR